MPDSDEFLNPLEKVGSSLLNGSLLHRRFVRVPDVENDELSFIIYQHFKLAFLVRSGYNLLGFLQLKSGDNKYTRARIIKVYRAFLINALVLLLR